MDDYFDNGKVYVWKETFAVVKAKSHVPGAFAVIHDKSEITAIIEQSKVRDEYVIEIEKDWRMLTFDMVLPFDLVGFLAGILKAMAEEKISIFAISAYSTDHILVKERDLAKAIVRLEKLGFSVKTG